MEHRSVVNLTRRHRPVGEKGGVLGYSKSDAYGSISTGEKFYYPPFSPPPKHHFDPDSNLNVETLVVYEDAGTTFLLIKIGNASTIGTGNDPGNVTLWIRNTRFRLKDGAGVGDLFYFREVDPETWTAA